MSYYENESAWSSSARTPSWEHQPQPPSRSGTGSAMSGATHQSTFESNAFASQFEEIERATDNLMKSGKWLPGAGQGAASPAQGLSTGRRDTSSPTSRGYDAYGSDPRMGGGSGPAGPGPSRHQSGADFEGGRPNSAGLQGYYAGQRFPGAGGRQQSEAEQVLQAKRRMAAQRERELRNYHQEQQYNRTASGVKTNRAMSPNTMNEDDRRELIARQHRALYGDHATLYASDTGPPSSTGSRPPSQDVRNFAGRASISSNSGFDPYNTSGDNTVQMPPRDRQNSSITSPIATQQSFGGVHLPESSSSSQASLADRAATSSPTALSSSPPSSLGGGRSGVAPIGTRPAGGNPSGPPGAAAKRSTTPMTPSSLSHGYTSGDSAVAQISGVEKERSVSGNSSSSNSNAAMTGSSVTDKSTTPSLGSWGTNSAVWGSGKGPLAVQGSVWG